MPSPTVFSQSTNAAPVQIEGRSESHTLHVRGHADPSGVENVLTGAGIVAILATLSTYYSGLSATKLAAIGTANNGNYLKVTAADVQAAVHSADQATVAASLATNVKTSGSVTRG